jgi:lipopolysaccharide/colanic/teichoic acid biosynthesis glycosyltransferase
VPEPISITISHRLGRAEAKRRLENDLGHIRAQLTTDYATRVALDRGYVENWSFWGDLTIIAKTARVVVATRDGC